MTTDGNGTHHVRPARSISALVGRPSTTVMYRPGTNLAGQREDHGRQPSTSMARHRWLHRPVRLSSRRMWGDGNRAAERAACCDGRQRTAGSARRRQRPAQKSGIRTPGQWTVGRERPSAAPLPFLRAASAGCYRAGRRRRREQTTHRSTTFTRKSTSPRTFTMRPVALRTDRSSHLRLRVLRTGRSIFGHPGFRGRGSRDAGQYRLSDPWRQPPAAIRRARFHRERQRACRSTCPRARRIRRRAITCCSSSNADGVPSRGRIVRVDIARASRQSMTLSRPRSRRVSRSTKVQGNPRLTWNGLHGQCRRHGVCRASLDGRYPRSRDHPGARRRPGPT